MLQVSEVLVVVPAFNEVKSIGQVVNQVVTFGFQTLVVDDGSIDQTADVARQHGAHVVSLPLNSGVGGALRCGFRYAVENGFAAVIQCDADGQHLPNHLSDLVDAANRTNAHMMIGSRFGSENTTHNPTVLRRFAMSVLSKVAQHATKHKITDSTSGFRLIRQPLLGELAVQLPAYYLGDTFETVVVAGRAGYHIEEIGVAMAPREFGNSSSGDVHSILLIAKVLTTVLLGIHFRLRRLK
ncbi:MAG: glycosyltransferase family 2 protein [Ilumatobacteraceae bacterium]|nr:glycosyltransferase family 2 protein [Ilumatobacteraceae bacterium]